MVVEGEVWQNMHQNVNILHYAAINQDPVGMQICANSAEKVTSFPVQSLLPHHFNTNAVVMVGTYV